MIKAVNLFKVSYQIREIFVISQAEIKLSLVFEDLLYVKNEIWELILIEDLGSVAHLSVYFEKLELIRCIHKE